MLTAIEFTAVVTETEIVLFRLAAVHWNITLPESTPPENLP